MSQEAHVMSYLAVRRALGLLGLALPIVLYAYARPFGYGMQPSISEFYHTQMGDVVVGSLVAIGVFLIAYKGYPRLPGERLSDQVVSSVAGLAAIGVALFPVLPPAFTDCAAAGTFPVEGAPVQGIVAHWCAFAWIHFASAMVFFLALAAFCFFLFPRGDQTADGRVDWRGTKNRLYLVCGVLLILSIAALLIYALVPSGTKSTLRAGNYIFWWETVGVVAFATSWLAKGRILEGVAYLMTRRASKDGPASGD